MIRRKTLMAAALAAGLLGSTVALAQTTRPVVDTVTTRPADVLAGRNGQGLSFDQIKSQLRASDEEWKVIGPKLRKVIAARRLADAGINTGPAMGNAGPGRGFGNRRGPGGGGFGPGGNDSFNGPAGPGGFRPGGFGPDGGGPGEFGPGGFSADENGVRRPPDVPAATNPTAPPPRDPAASGVARPSNPENANVAGPNPGGLGGPAGNLGGPGGPPGFAFAGGPVMQAMLELQTAAADEKTSPGQLAEKIAAVRDARRKARADMETAVTDLVRVLTLDQQATLIGLGYLE